MHLITLRDHRRWWGGVTRLHVVHSLVLQRAEGGVRQVGGLGRMVVIGGTLYRQTDRHTVRLNCKGLIVSLVHPPPPTQQTCTHHLPPPPTHLHLHRHPHTHGPLYMLSCVPQALFLSHVTAQWGSVRKGGTSCQRHSRLAPQSRLTWACPCYKHKE